MACTWEQLDIKNMSIAEMFLYDGVENFFDTDKLTEKDFPGALHGGWDQYYEWANKDHGAWQQAFEKAECERLKESRRWLRYYEKIYTSDWNFFKKIMWYALNAVQIWALWKQFRQQKEIAQRTYEVADRTQKIAEELYAYYERTYQPHEVSLSSQINTAFTSKKINYNAAADRMMNNVKVAFLRSKADLQRCSSAHCSPITDNQFKQFDIETAQAVGNTRTGAYRWAELMKEHSDAFYLEMRMKFIQVGRHIAADGQSGFMKAFGTFSSFGADPGAALSQLLGTFSNTMGQMLNTPIMPNGQMPNVQPSPNFEPFMTRVMQNGDVQQGKVGVPLGKTTFSG